MIAINIREERGKVEDWVKRKNVSSRVLLDPDGAVTQAYGVTATPTVFLLGRDGRLIAKALGTKDWTGDKGRALFRLLLAE